MNSIARANCFNPQTKQKLLAEIVAYGDSIEELNDACEALVELSACSKVRDQTIEAQSNYSRLVTLAQGKPNFISKPHNTKTFSLFIPLPVLMDFR